MMVKEDRKLNYKNFDEEKDKAFYAAYLNTAKQNVFIILRDISERLGLNFDKTSDDKMLSGDLWTRLKHNDQPEISQKIIESLKQHFTFAENIALNHSYNKSNEKEREASPEDYHDVFQFWIKKLLQFRNFYTHAAHDPIIMDDAILEGMRDILYYANWQKFKNKKSLLDEDVKHLDGRQTV